jgi:deoxyribodipyrimidine photolyase-related protein
MIGTTPRDACPYAAGYRAFLERNEAPLRGNHPMRRPIQGLHRLADLDPVLEQERARGSRAS